MGVVTRLLDNTEGVSIEDLPELGGAAAVANIAFKAGQQVFREKALVIAPSATNLARVRAYCQLEDHARRMLRETFFSEAPSVRCAATAACESAEATGDTAVEVLSALHAEGWDLELPEVEAVIRVWNLNAYDNALAPVACKVSHSCAPNLSIRVDTASGIIEGTACRSIAVGESLGSWYVQDTGLWWMGADVRRTFLLQDRGFRCLCVRCRSPDLCRALPCDACGALGSVVPCGHKPTAVEVGLTWHCEKCGREAFGDALQSSAEVQLTQRVLLELKPARGVPKATAEELVALAADARSRLGDHHWTAAAAALVLHFRSRAEGGLLTPFAVACGLRFLGWLVDRKLAPPPAGIVRTPIAMAIDCIAWLCAIPKALSNGHRALAHRPDAIQDLRCVGSRLLKDFLLPIFDATGDTVAKVAGTGERVAMLKEWLADLQKHCGRCTAPLQASPAACGRCKQVRYCSRECQQADWKERHKAGCLPSTMSLSEDLTFKLIVQTASEGGYLK